MSDVTTQDVAEAVRAVIEEARLPHANTLELTAVQKGVGTMFLAGCMWVGATVYSSSLELSAMREKLAVATVDRYTSKDAERDLRTVYADHNGLERRVTVIEEKLQ